MQVNGKEMKQFKARIDKPCDNWHAIEVHLQAESIIDAGVDILDQLKYMCIEARDITKLVEVDHVQK